MKNSSLDGGALPSGSFPTRDAAALLRVAQVSGVRHATVSDVFLLHDHGGLAVRQCASQQSCCVEQNSGGTPTALQRGSAALEQSCCLKPNGARSPTALSANRPTAAQVHCMVPRVQQTDPQPRKFIPLCHAFLGPSLSIFGPSGYTLFAIPVYLDALSRSLLSARQGIYTLFAMDMLPDALSRFLLSVRQGIRCLQSTYTLTPPLSISTPGPSGYMSFAIDVYPDGLCRFLFPVARGLDGC